MIYWALNDLNLGESLFSKVDERHKNEARRDLQSLIKTTGAHQNVSLNRNQSLSSTAPFLIDVDISFFGGRNDA